jgi:tripartite-type tricarboxylate transporter receptor subunit TctC
MLNSLRFFIISIGLCLAANLTAAAEFPTRPITIIVPFSAGSSADTTVRVVANEMSKLLGQPLVVENKAGAQGIIGTQSVAHSVPDGYTLLLGSKGSMIANVVLFRKPPYDSMKDFLPIGGIATAPTTLVIRSDFPAKTVTEFVEQARKNKGQITMGYAAGGSHTTVVLFESRTDVNFNQVAYKDQSRSILDLESGRLDSAMLPLGSALMTERSGKTRILGITASARSRIVPDIPTIAESFPGVEQDGWLALMAPAGTPQPVANTLQDALAHVLTLPVVRDKIQSSGQDLFPRDSRQLSKLIATDLANMRKLVVDANLDLM